MANKKTTPLHLYCVTQDVSGLYGEYVTRAVVAADSSYNAKTHVLGYCITLAANDEDGHAPVIRRLRLRARLLGPAVRGVKRGVLALETGTDWDGPRSDSDADLCLEEEDEEFFEDEEEDEEDVTTPSVNEKGETSR